MVDLSRNQILETINVEYKVIREETLFRLKAQQELINYSLIVAGLLAPLISLSTVVNIRTLLGSLLVGPLICFFLQIIYYKHHIYIQLMSQYIEWNIGINLQKAIDLENVETNNNNNKKLEIKINDLFGWDKFLTNSLLKSRIIGFFTLIFGFAESSIPSLVGSLYLFVFYSMKFGSLMGLNSYEIYLFNTLFVAELICIFLILLFGLAVRIWSSNKRRKHLLK